MERRPPAEFVKVRNKIREWFPYGVGRIFYPIDITRSFIVGLCRLCQISLIWRTIVLSRPIFPYLVAQALAIRLSWKCGSVRQIFHNNGLQAKTRTEHSDDCYAERN